MKTTEVNRPVKSPIIVPVSQLNREPYASILCFPNPTVVEVQSRIEELHSLGVAALEFSGSASVFGVKVPVLGKGFVGIVVVAYVGTERLAVKILRSDSGRSDLLHEAKMLRFANAVDVGPRLVSATKNFLLMQLIKGNLLPDWLETHKDTEQVKRVLREVLAQCFRLDQAGLDHGELSKAPKHLLVDMTEKLFIVDFETASTERRVANVTAVSQYLFVGNSSAARTLMEVLGEQDKRELLVALNTYKKNRTSSNFESLLSTCLG